MGFDPSEARDKDGKWTNGGSVSLPTHAAIDARMDELQHIVKRHLPGGNADNGRMSPEHQRALYDFHAKLQQAHAEFKAATGAPASIQTAGGHVAGPRIQFKKGTGAQLASEAKLNYSRSGRRALEAWRAARIGPKRRGD